MRPKSYPAEESRTREYREKCKTDENRRSVRSFIQPASKGHANVSFFFVFFLFYTGRERSKVTAVSRRFDSAKTGGEIERLVSIFLKFHWSIVEARVFAPPRIIIAPAFHVYYYRSPFLPSNTTPYAVLVLWNSMTLKTFHHTRDKLLSPIIEAMLNASTMSKY